MEQTNRRRWEESQCGWLKDKFGLSWQVVLTIWAAMVSDSDAEKVNRVMQKVMTIKKLDLKALEEAYSNSKQSL